MCWGVVGKGAVPSFILSNVVSFPFHSIPFTGGIVDSNLPYARTSIQQAKQGRPGGFGASRQHSELVLSSGLSSHAVATSVVIFVIVVVCSLERRRSFLSLFVRYPP